MRVGYNNWGNIVKISLVEKNVFLAYCGKWKLRLGGAVVNSKACN
jgi:hypothetical protein